MGLRVAAFEQRVQSPEVEEERAVMRGVVAAMSAAVLALSGVLMGGAPATRAAGPIYSPPKQYYLSLGDSVAFGYQQHKVLDDVQATGTADPATFATGYT